jgi:peptide/nickel transport system substrate-binding protein
VARRTTARAVVLVISMLGTACTGTESPEPTPTGRASPVQRGGTLRVGLPSSGFGLTPSPVLVEEEGLDPQKDYWFTSWELYRCCLLRTLLSYEGRPTAEGGSILRPDLAASMPEVSPDGLTWTFRIKPGLRYGPPLEAVQMTAQDFIRALEREANPKASEGGYSFYYSIVQGFDEFSAGTSSSISGLEAPDDRTLRVHLTHPAGDLGELFSLPATAPIPPSPADPSAPLGVATGHDGGYGRFLVASGPYMIEGSEDLDFSLPPEQQRAVSGYVPRKSIALVRNPSWKASTDPLRPAYVDRIEVTLGGELVEESRKIDVGTLDLIMFAGAPPAAPEDQIEAYAADPSKGRVETHPRDFIRYISINLAVPPFDDLHVRKAMNYALDKTGIRERRGGRFVGEIIGHIALNSLERNLLLNYDPYGSLGQTGDTKAARTEMALSNYDRDGDGICDAAACKSVVALAFDAPIWRAQTKLIRRNLLEIGIDLDVQYLDPPTLFGRLFDRPQKVPLALTISWGRDTLNASNYFVPLFHSSALRDPAAGNFSLLGASPDQLQSWGYPVTEVLSVDVRIDACLTKVGQAQLQCWVELDQYLMENVVPWVPYLSENHVQVIPARILHFSHDQFSGLPALDRIALREGGA